MNLAMILLIITIISAWSLMIYVFIENKQFERNGIRRVDEWGDHLLEEILAQHRAWDASIEKVILAYGEEQGEVDRNESEWIEYKEGEPSQWPICGKAVMIFSRSEGMGIGALEWRENGQEWIFSFQRMLNPTVAQNVTHWMSLPDWPGKSQG